MVTHEGRAGSKSYILLQVKSAPGKQRKLPPDANQGQAARPQPRAKLPPLPLQRLKVSDECASVVPL